MGTIKREIQKKSNMQWVVKSSKNQISYDLYSDPTGCTLYECYL